MTTPNTKKCVFVGHQLEKSKLLFRYLHGRRPDFPEEICPEHALTYTIPTGEALRWTLSDAQDQDEWVRGADVVVFVYSMVDRPSLDNIARWKRRVKRRCPKPVRVLVGSGVHLVEDAEVQAFLKARREVAVEPGAGRRVKGFDKYFECDADGGDYVKELFEYILSDPRPRSRPLTASFPRLSSRNLHSSADPDRPPSDLPPARPIQAVPIQPPLTNSTDPAPSTPSAPFAIDPNYLRKLTPGQNNITSRTIQAFLRRYTHQTNDFVMSFLQETSYYALDRKQYDASAYYNLDRQQYFTSRMHIKQASEALAKQFPIEPSTPGMQKALTSPEGQIIYHWTYENQLLEQITFILENDIREEILKHRGFFEALKLFVSSRPIKEPTVGYALFKGDPVKIKAGFKPGEITRSFKVLSLSEHNLDFVCTICQEIKVVLVFHIGDNCTSAARLSEFSRYPAEKEIVVLPYAIMKCLEIKQEKGITYLHYSILE